MITVNKAGANKPVVGGYVKVGGKWTPVYNTYVNNGTDMKHGWRCFWNLAGDGFFEGGLGSSSVGWVSSHVSDPDCIPAVLDTAEKKFGPHSLYCENKKSITNGVVGLAAGGAQTACVLPSVLEDGDTITAAGWAKAKDDYSSLDLQIALIANNAVIHQEAWFSPALSKTDWQFHSHTFTLPPGGGAAEYVAFTVGIQRTAGAPAWDYTADRTSARGWVNAAALMVGPSCPGVFGYTLDDGYAWGANPIRGDFADTRFGKRVTTVAVDAP